MCDVGRAAVTARHRRPLYAARPCTPSVQVSLPPGPRAALS
ncbi:hypothetical protein ACFW7K_00245 [Streptomyces sp. NPDC058735]